MTQKTKCDVCREIVDEVFEHKFVGGRVVKLCEMCDFSVNNLSKYEKREYFSTVIDTIRKRSEGMEELNN
jgi:hypothetical protein